MKYNLIAFLAIFLIAANSFAQFTGKPQYLIQTKRDGNFLGNITIELFPKIAPLHTKNFDSLVSKQFFDSTAFHRVIPGFMIQGGDPNSKHGPKSTWGIGDTSQPTVNAEFSKAKHVRGILSAARDNDTNSANSQFFICVATAAWLDGQYSVYGRVVSGMNYVDTIVLEPRDNKDNPLKKIEMFITYIGSNDTIPVPPSLLSPLNYEQGIQATHKFSWTPVSDGIIYTMELANDSLFTQNKKIYKSGSNSITLNYLIAKTTYYWRIKTNNGGHESVNSAIYSFKTGTGSATLVYPHDTATKVATSPVFIWKSVSGATSYRLQISKNFSFSQNGIVYNQAGINDTTHQVTGLTANLQYFWRVRSISGTYEGYYSAYNTFFTLNNTGINNSGFYALGYQMSNPFPNPAKEKTTLHFKLPKEEYVVIKLYNTESKEVTYLQNKLYTPGEHSLLIDCSKYSTGLYILSIYAGEFIESKNIVIER